MANFGLNLVLIPTTGAVGTAVVTVTTHTIYVAVNLYIVHGELSLGLERLGRTVGRIRLITGVMAVAILLVTPLISRPVMLIGAIGLGVFIWSVLVVTTGLIDVQEARSVIN